jgi:hypothetical protein
VEFNHFSVDAGAPSSPLTREPTVDGLITDVALDASAELHITDLATTRAWFGWAVDQFMPYMTLGLAVARADVSLSTQASVTNAITLPLVGSSFSRGLKPRIRLTSGASRAAVARNGH